MAVRKGAVRFPVVIGIAIACSAPIARADTLVTATRYEWDAEGQLVRETVEPGAPECLQRIHGYDAWGNRTSTAASACEGATGHALSSATTARTQRIAFGADGRFALSLTNALGHTETRTVDAAWGWVLASRDADGVTVQQQFDGFGRLVRRTHADRTATTWERLACPNAQAGCEVASTRQRGAWVLLEQSWSAAGTPLGGARVQVHDAAGRLLRSQAPGFDGQPVVQDTEYDRLGLVGRQSAPYAPSAFDWDSRAAVWTDYTWDVLGRPLAQARPDRAAAGGIALVRHEHDGLASSVVDSLGRRSRVQRNLLGLPERIADAAGGVLVHRWDAAGRLVQSHLEGSAQAASRIAWDRRGRRTALSDPSLGTWRYAYNAYGELVWQQDSLGQTTTYAYDALGRLLQRREPDLLSTWRWDRGADGAPCGGASTGRLCEAQADNGWRRSHRYDALGRPISSATVLDEPQRPALLTQSWDPLTGRLAEQGWPTGLRARYDYTEAGWLRAVSAEGAGLPAAATFTVQAMNPRGQLVRWSQGPSSAQRAYAADSGRLLQQEESALKPALVQAWRHDSQGNLLARSQLAPGASWQEDYAYDALDRLQRITTAAALGPGTGAGTGAGAGGMTGAIGAPAPQAVQLLYDPRGNITYKSDVGRYWYDPQRPDRLLQVTLEAPAGAQVAPSGTRALAWAYDELAAPVAPPAPPPPGSPGYPGAALPPSPPPPPPPPPEPSLDDAMAWRGNGNLVYAISHEPASGRRVLREHRYTSFDMPLQYGLRELTAAAGLPAAPARTLRFVYGAEHQRVRQQAEVAADPARPGSAASSTTTWYLHAQGGQELVYEKALAPDGALEHRHYLSAAGLVWAMVVSRTPAAPSASTAFTPGVFMPPPPPPPPLLAPATGLPPAPAAPLASPAPLAASVHYLHQDHLGSLVAISDAAGNVIERLAYDAWGRRRWPDGRADAQGEVTGWLSVRGYTLHEHLDEVGLVHMNGRVYDPLVARFLSADPYVQSPQLLQSHNRYAYVGNNPTGHSDPSGYFSWRRVVRGAAAVAVAVFAPQLFASYGFAAAGISSATAMAINTVAAGALAGAVATGNARGALQGAVSAGLFNMAGTIGQAASAERYLAHAAAGCIGAAVGGGRCRDGAAGAVAGQGATQFLNAFDTLQTPLSRGVAVSIGGGAGAAAAGGRFDEGAITAAFGYAYNECAHTRACGSDSTRVTVSANPVVGNLAHAEIQISSGYEFTVLEAQPRVSNWLLRLAPLSNGANNGEAFSVDLTDPNGRTAGQFALDIGSAARSYSGGLVYGLPTLGTNFNQLGAGYNSNSFVGGVLDAAAPGSGLRYVIDRAAAARGYKVPGMGKPIPLATSVTR